MIIVSCTRAVMVEEASALATHALHMNEQVAVLCPNWSIVALVRREAPNVNCIDANGTVWPSDSDDWGGDLRSRMSPSLRGRLLSLGPVRFVAVCLRALLLTKRFRRLLRSSLAHAVYVFDDRGDVFDMALLKECRRAGVRTVVGPYALARREGRIFLRRRLSEHHVSPLWRYIIRCIEPTALCESQDEWLSYYLPWDTLALAAAGLLHSNPWTLGTGNADTVAVVGEDDREVLISEGIAPWRIAVTGQPSHDAIYCGLHARDSIRARIMRDIKQKLIICAVPHHFEEGLIDRESQVEEIQSLFATLSEVARRNDGEVVLSLHPKSKASDYEAYAVIHDINIANDRLSAIIAAADIFVATWSSTVRWAILLRIPAVVIDVLQRRYTVYDQFGCVERAETYKELMRILHSLLADYVHYQGQQAKASAGAQRFAALDGRAGERLLTLAAMQSPADEFSEAVYE